MRTFNVVFVEYLLVCPRMVGKLGYKCNKYGYADCQCLVPKIRTVSNPWGNVSN